MVHHVVILWVERTGGDANSVEHGSAGKLLEVDNKKQLRNNSASER